MNPPEFSKIHREIIERAVARVGPDENWEIYHQNMDPVSAETYRRLFGKLIRPGNTIVNIGPGFSVDVTRKISGLNTEVFDACVKNDATLIALDIDHDNLITHKDLKELSGSKNLQVVEANGLNMPFEEGKISGIVSSNLINCPDENMKLEEQADKLIEEARRALRPGGFIIISSFGYAIRGKDRQGRTLYNDKLKKEDILTLKRLEEILLSKGFVDIAELEIDPEKEENVYKYTNVRLKKSIEAGGFIAYKPRARK